MRVFQPTMMASAPRTSVAMSVVSQTLANLEAQIGVKLFDRSARYPRLTEEGRSLLEPEWSGVKRRTVNIGGRAISALIQTQGINDLARIYATAQQDEADFNLAYIGSDFNDLHSEEFSAAYMKRLFDYGYQLSVKGYAWHKAPPGEAMPEQH